MQIVNIGLTPADLNLPYDTFRTHQLETAEQIINSTAKVVIMRAPTGSGKSLVARIPQIIQADRRLILTKTKLLQEQYERESIDALYGRTNYQCNRFPVVTSDQGICHFGQSCSLKYGGCDYYDQKSLVASKSIAVLNYPYFFLEANGPGKFSNYDWIIADEGHAIPEQISHSYAITVLHSDVRKVNARTPSDKFDLPAWITWAEQIQKIVQRKSHHAAGDFIKTIERLKTACERLGNIREIPNWIIETDKFKTIFRPIWIDGLAQAFFWRHAKRFLLMSATIDPDYVLDQLGMDKSQTQFIDVPSTFPAKSRPLWLYPQHQMGSHATNLDILAMIKDIDLIIAKHQGRGLIHCASYQLARAIEDFSRHKMRLMTHTQLTRPGVITRFATVNNNNKVLISPSMTEGIDLPYDMCEFQIIAKIPFPYRGDKVWAARFASDKDRADKAYILEAIGGIVQAYGRGMRAADDRCETYILDKNFVWLYNQYLNHFPLSFQDAVHVKDRI